MAAFSYPGVYVEELPSAQHTITGVATSIGAFVGWAAQGPVNQAALIQSWNDYLATFGGLDARTKLGYAVNQFFANGGQQCYVVRLVWDGSMPPANGNPAVAETAVATGLGYAMAQITATVTTASGKSVAGSLSVGIGQPVLESIEVTAGSLPAGATLPPMPAGSTGNLSAQPVYSDGGSSPPLPGGSLQWTSSDSTVVSVNASTGAIVASNPGTATLTATSGLVSGSITVTVVQATSVTLSVSSPVTTLAAGQQAQFHATATYNSGAAPDVTQGVVWTTSAASSVATLGTTGLFSVLPSVAASSTATVTATFPWAIGGTAPSQTTPAISITAPVPIAAAAYPASPVIAVAQTVTLNLWGPESNSPQQLVEITSGSTTWTSSNPLVATVAGNVVTAVAAGTATITGVNGSFTASTTVTVIPATTTLNAIAISPTQMTLAAGLTQQLKATGVYSDGTTADLTGSVTWGDAASSAASISVSGLLTAKTASGSPLTITAAWQGVNAAPTASLTITAAVLDSIQVAPSTAGLTSIPSGSTATFTATGTYSDGTTATIPSPTWSASPASIVTITPLGAATATSTGGGALSLFAKNPGAWGNTLRITVTAQPPPNSTRFNVLVQRVAPSGQLQTLESFVNLSVSPSDPNYVVTVIDNDSAYVTFVNPATGAPVVPTAAPSSTSTTPVALSGGTDGGVLVPTDGNFELALLSLSNSDAGINLLDHVDIFNLLCVPAETDAPTISTLQEFCSRKRALYIVDPPLNTTVANLIASGPVGSSPGSITAGNAATNSAYYFPWILAPDPLAGNRPTLFPPCGFVAGIYAATDAAIGVWKAPAGINAALIGNSGLQFVLTDLENGSLNPQAVNCLRQFKTYGDVVWGARTLAGNDQTGSQWKYVPIRRLALYIESSLWDGTQWVVFEPNDEALWGQIRLNVGAFMQGLFLKGAFAGTTPSQAYFVKCDAENNPPASVALGVVNILVGFAPLYPAEFVLIQIQQIINQS